MSYHNHKPYTIHHTPYTIHHTPYTNNTNQMTVITRSQTASFSIKHHRFFDPVKVFLQIYKNKQTLCVIRDLFKHINANFAYLYSDLDKWSPSYIMKIDIFVIAMYNKAIEFDNQLREMGNSAVVRTFKSEVRKYIQLLVKLQPTST